MIMTLQEILETCNDWLQFCSDYDVDEYAVNEGGGDTEVSLTVMEASRYGIVFVRNEPTWTITSTPDPEPRA